MITYIITYYSRGSFIDEESTTDGPTAQDMVNVAMHVGMCDAAALTVMMGEDVYSYTELFVVDGVWMQVYTSNLTNRTTLEVM